MNRLVPLVKNNQRKDLMSTNKRTITIYWEHIKKHRVSFFAMLILIPTGVLLIDTLLPYYLAQAIGALTSNNYTIINSMLMIAAAIGLVGAVVNFAGFKTMIWHEAHIIEELSDSTFKKVINKDMSFFVNTKVGALTTRFIDFVRSEVAIQDLLIIRTLGFVLSVGVGLAILAVQSLMVSGIVLVLIVLLIVQIRWSIKIRAPWRHTRKKIRGEIHGAIADAVTNNLVVKTFANEQYEVSRIDRLTESHRKAYQKDIGFTVTEGSLRVLLLIIAQIIAIYMSMQMVIAGTITIATAVFILAYLQRIGSQLFVLGDILNGYDQALLDAGPMSDILYKKDHIVDDEQAEELVITEPSIDFRNVSYHYPDNENPALSNINLVIPAGQKVGLVGHSGAGKTTISHLLLRFDDPTDGAIFISGSDTRHTTQHSLRESIAFVPQEPMLFHRSLRENIAYGKLGATDDEIIQAARRANAWEFIEKLPEKLETMVGERGVKLSGGQRQRIAIARAILKDAPILVLDEATSALDSESEKLIQDSLTNLMKNRTSIVIAHRLSTIAKLDRIIVLDDGKIVEDGTHAELLAKNGIYSKLWNHQSGGFIEE